MRHIALLGKARSGKDTAAGHLVTLGYTRFAFADPLKDALLRTNPLVQTGYNVYVRLDSLIKAAGWEYTKDKYPEVRRLLQNYGQSIRDIDPYFWVSATTYAVDLFVANTQRPVVVSDVRYRNEAEALKRRGFRLVRITRPYPPLAGYAHTSETELDSYDVDASILNAGSVDTLRDSIERLTY